MILDKQPKTFVIALKNHSISESQLQDCLKSAEKFNWNVEIFWGVNGATITEHTWKEENIFPRLDKPTMSRPGVQGCFLSHWLLWKKCIELNQPIIILEHDAIIQQPWQSLTINESLIKMHRPYIGKKLKVDPDTGSWTKSGHAYCISVDHARRLISFTQKIGAIAVDMLIGSNVISVAYLTPSWVERQNTYSTTNNLEV
jgi:GR25 family glycosyltransferase involved in LPS biosynthesis